MSSALVLSDSHSTERYTSKQDVGLLSSRRPGGLNLGKNPLCVLCSLTSYCRRLQHVYPLAESLNGVPRITACGTHLPSIVFMVNEENKSHPILSLLSHCLTLSLFFLSWFLCRHSVLQEKPCLSFSSLIFLPCHQIAYMAPSLMLGTPSY